MIIRSYIWLTGTCFALRKRGLGIFHLKDMNMALLSKWWFNYWNHGVKGKWKEIIRANYEKNLASFFWDSVQNVS